MLAGFDLDDSLGEKTGAVKEVKFRGGEPRFVPGKIGQAAVFDGQGYVDAGDAGELDLIALGLGDTDLAHLGAK